MTKWRTRVALLAGFIALLAAILVGGSWLLRSLLPADQPSEPPIFRPPTTSRPSPTATLRPGTSVQILPLRPTTSAPAASPPPATQQSHHSYLPEISRSVDELARPPLDFNLTPEPSATSVLEPTIEPAPTAPPLQPPATPELIVATPVPQPTPVPSPTRGPLRVTKLGVGLYDSGGALLPLLDQYRPSTILLMDPSVDFAKEVRRMFPKAFIVGRIFETNQALDNPAARGTAFADRVAQTALPLKGTVDAWMSYNEATSHDVIANYQAYNTFQVAFAHQLQDTYGIPAVAGNDGPATIDPADYARYFAEAIRTSKYFGLHTYSPAGETSMRTDRSRALVFRHREVHDALVAAGIQAGPFLITEVGLWDGWRGVASEESMAADYTWFADQIANDDYVLGAMAFGLFNGDRWANFNIANTSISSRIGQYNTSAGQSTR